MGTRSPSSEPGGVGVREGGFRPMELPLLPLGGLLLSFDTGRPLPLGGRPLALIGRPLALPGLSDAAVGIVEMRTSGVPGRRCSDSFRRSLSSSTERQLGWA